MIIVKIKGGLGNQLFQYASAAALAGKNNTDLFFDLSFFEKDSYKDVYRLDRYPINAKTANRQDIDKLKNLNSPGFLFRLLKKFRINNKYYRKSHCNERNLNNYLKDKFRLNYSIYLEGWLANPNYFDEIRDQLLSVLIPKKVSSLTLEVSQKISNCDSIAVHIRRGDYLNKPYFVNLSTSYYRQAISYMIGNIKEPKFFFFSDDIDYVKHEYRDIENAVFLDFNNNKTNEYSTLRDVEDLYLISQCKHQIIANSTFSWWGAWLNDNVNKIVIAPKTWSNNKAAQKRYEKGSLIPETWLKI